MKSKKDPPQGKGSVSRRGFIRGVGVGGGALGLVSASVPAAAQSTGTLGPGPVPVTLKINGQTKNVTVEPRVTLLDALRNHLDMTGAKRVCDRGTCGACTVIMNGKVVYACSVLAVDAQGKDIQTIEGLGQAGRTHPVAAAFVRHDAQQCGYCTPGFVMAAKGLLDRNPNVRTEAEVEQALGGNLCRCGTYVGVRKAVLDAAREMKTRGGRNA